MLNTYSKHSGCVTTAGITCTLLSRFVSHLAITINAISNSQNHKQKTYIRKLIAVTKGTVQKIENTMLVSFVVMFIRRDKKQRRNSEACRASPTCFWASLISLISKDPYVIFYLSCIISRFNGKKTAKQMKSRHSFVRTC